MSYWSSKYLLDWHVFMDNLMPVAASAAHMHAAKLTAEHCGKTHVLSCASGLQVQQHVHGLTVTLRLYILRDVVASRGVPITAIVAHCSCRQYACTCTVHAIAIMLGVNNDILLLELVHQLNTAKRSTSQHP
jgi:hypothetical protein